MDRKELMEMHDTLTDALEFLKYFSDSPESLDDRVQKQIGVVEREISKTEGEFQE